MLRQRFSRPDIKDAMQPFLQERGIREDLVVIEQPCHDLAKAFGSSAFQTSDVVIFVAPGFYEEDKDACLWVMKHEIQHIKNNDCFKKACVSTVSRLAASILGMYALSFVSVLVLSGMASVASRIGCSRWQEAAADDFAIKHSSNDELLGGRRILLTWQNYNMRQPRTLWNRIAISPTGDNRVDFDHPSMTCRIQKIEQALRDRGVAFETPEEQTKLTRLQSWIDRQLDTTSKKTA